MQRQLKYVELKSGYTDNGPAWIGYVELSKSGKTVYFNGHALKGNGHGLCSDIETSEVYWISGIKKNGQDRHRNGHGKIKIDRKVIDEYLKLVDFDILDAKSFEIVDLIETDKRKFNDIENSKIDTQNDIQKYDDLVNLSIPELQDLIVKLKRNEDSTNSNNGVKYYTIKRVEAERYLNELLAQDK